MVRAYSSVVEHYVDIVGVASSILATPTIHQKPAGNGGFFVSNTLKAIGSSALIISRQDGDKYALPQRFSTVKNVQNHTEITMTENTGICVGNHRQEKARLLRSDSPKRLRRNQPNIPLPRRGSCLGQSGGSKTHDTER